MEKDDTPTFLQRRWQLMMMTMISLTEIFPQITKIEMVTNLTKNAWIDMD